MRQTIEVNGVTITVGEPTALPGSRSSGLSWFLAGIIVFGLFCSGTVFASAIFGKQEPLPLQPVQPNIGSSSQQVIIQPDCKFGCVVNGPIEVNNENNAVVDQSTTTTTSTNTSNCINVIAGVCVQAYGSQTGKSGGAAVAPQPNAQYLPTTDVPQPQQSGGGLPVIPALGAVALVVGLLLVFNGFGKRKNY